MNEIMNNNNNNGYMTNLYENPSNKNNINIKDTPQGPTYFSFISRLLRMEEINPGTLAKEPYIISSLIDAMFEHLYTTESRKKFKQNISSLLKESNLSNLHNELFINAVQDRVRYTNHLNSTEQVNKISPKNMLLTIQFVIDKLNKNNVIKKNVYNNIWYSAIKNKSTREKINSSSITFNNSGRESNKKIKLNNFISTNVAQQMLPIATSKILMKSVIDNRKKFIVSCHGILNSSQNSKRMFFRVPNNIIIVYITPLGYSICKKITPDTKRIFQNKSLIFNFLKDPNGEKIPNELKKSTIIPPGQVAINLKLDMDAENYNNTTMFITNGKDVPNYLFNKQMELRTKRKTEGYGPQLATKGRFRRHPYQKFTGTQRMVPAIPPGMSMPTNLFQHCNFISNIGGGVIIVDSCRTVTALNGKPINCHYFRETGNKVSYNSYVLPSGSRYVNLSQNHNYPNIKRIQNYKKYEQSLQNNLKKK